jgi:GDP-L-fucose synthase
MKILLTGSSGMVGRNILEHPGINLYTVLTPTQDQLDLLDYYAVNQYLQTNKPDLVIHAAGRVGGIHANMREPVRFLMENLDMGRNIVWASRQTGIRKLINLGSSCMYPRDAENPLTEDKILKGELEPTNEGYALAKIATERLCEYIMREDPEYSYKTLVPCNLYGRWDKFDPVHSHLVPAVITKVFATKESGQIEVEIWGDGTARREFMYAGDLADCIIRTIENYDTLPFLMNVGIGRDYTVNEYYRYAAEVIGYTGRFVYDLTKPVGMKQKLVSIEKQKHWGWQAKTDLHEGLKRTYNYFLELQKKC